MCKTKNLRKVHHDDSLVKDSGDEVFLGAVNSKLRDSQWVIMLQLNDKSIDFQIDTGAEASLITELVYKNVESPGDSRRS